jgi:small conductance mechanosensitive channel
MVAHASLVGAVLAAPPSPTPTPAVPGGETGRAVFAFLQSRPGRLLLALVVLVAGWYVSVLSVRYLGRPMARRFQRPSVARTVLRSVRVGLLGGTVLAALAVLGLELPDIVLSVTVFSAVLGLVLAPIVGSVVNGLFVLADQPYEVGDLVEIRETSGGTRGFVEDITLRYTKVFTLDNTFLVVPNSTMRERDVVNFSAEDERTRMTNRLLITYESDVEEARRLAERAARDVEAVITGGPDIRIGAARYPAGPTCYVEEFADNGVLLNLRYWAKQPYKQLTVTSSVNERVWAALADSDVVVAYPHQHLVFDETSGEMQVRVDEHPTGPHGNGTDGSPGGNGTDGAPGDNGSGE